jgi:hypothetical protein
MGLAKKSDRPPLMLIQAILPFLHVLFGFCALGLVQGHANNQLAGRAGASLINALGVVTLFIEAFDPSSRSLASCNAGHNSPIVLRNQSQGLDA